MYETSNASLVFISLVASQFENKVPKELSHEDLSSSPLPFMHKSIKEN